MRNRRRRRRKVKNFILKTVAWIVGILWLLSACAIDSPSWIPTIVCVVCTAYLALYSWANNWWYDERIDWYE